MAKTSAERQAAYRAKRAGQDSPERRLSTWISAETDLALQRFADGYGVTKRAVIELLVSNEDGKLAGALKSKVALLRRNELRGGAPTGKAARDSKLLRNEVEKTNTTKKPRAKRIQELPRNTAPETANKLSKRPPDSVPKQKSSQSAGEQVGFEF